MKNYVEDKKSIIDKELVSSIDELPLWSAPFGISLLDKVHVAGGLKLLDIGCGTGFPLIEMAQRLGNTSIVYGIDPWEEMLERAGLKIRVHSINNAVLIKGSAEKLPFENDFFDVIISNNGINNVEDIDKTFAECSRVSRQGAQLLFTMNTDKSMLEFYDVLKDELKKDRNYTALEKLERHIYEKRRPLNEIKQLLLKNNFGAINIDEKVFYIRFADAGAMFNHSFIKNWFLPSWLKLVEHETDAVFYRVKTALDESAKKNGEIKLTIPYAVIEAARQ